MHGIIFASLFDYARDRLGARQASAIFDGRSYAMADSHSDEEFTNLLLRTGARRALEMDDLLRDFGSFTAQNTFARLYPALFEIAGDTRSFLLTVEDRIHELVRATIPNAEPPALYVQPGPDGGVKIEYTSPRRLCRLLEGLVLGTGLHYGEELELREVACMLAGDRACRFEVRTSLG